MQFLRKYLGKNSRLKKLPLYKAVTISASEIQNLADGEISTVPSAPIGVCSPPKPLTLNPSGLAISFAIASKK